MLPFSQASKGPELRGRPLSPAPKGKLASLFPQRGRFPSAKGPRNSGHLSPQRQRASWPLFPQQGGFPTPVRDVCAHVLGFFSLVWFTRRLSCRQILFRHLQVDTSHWWHLYNPAYKSLATVPLYKSSMQKRLGSFGDQPSLQITSGATLQI